MKYFKGMASASFVGTDIEWKIKAESEEEALNLSSDFAIQHIDSFEDEDDEDDNIEKEYDYGVTEITKEEYQDLNDLDEL